MPTGIAAAMLTELQGVARVHPVFELTLDGTTHLFADEPVASESQGRYEPFVSNWGIIERLPGEPPDYNLINPRITNSIYDQDRVLQKAIGGPGNGAVIDSVSKTILRSYNVVLASHYTLVDGIVADYRLTGDRMWQFVSTPDDRKLRVSGNNIPRISEIDWPDAPKASIGTDGQIIFGEHLSSAIEGATGMVSCTMVHEDNNWWYVTIGKLTTGAIVNVWRSGTLATSDFTKEEKLINGTWYTTIRDTAGTSTSSDTITIDVYGIEDDGRGTGSVVTESVEMLEIFLSNFVFNAYPAGSVDGIRWLSRTQAPINTTHFDESATFLNNRGKKCAKVIKSSDIPLNVLNTWCKDNKISPFWAWDWDLGIRPFNNAPSSIYIDGRHIHQVGHKILSQLQGQTDTNKVVSKFVVDYLLRDTVGSFAFQRDVEDPDRTLISDSSNYTYGEARAF